MDTLLKSTPEGYHFGGDVEMFRHPYNYLVDLDDDPEDYCRACEVLGRLCRDCKDCDACYDNDGNGYCEQCDSQGAEIEEIIFRENKRLIKETSNMPCIWCEKKKSKCTRILENQIYTPLFCDTFGEAYHPNDRIGLTYNSVEGTYDIDFEFRENYCDIRYDEEDSCRHRLEWKELEDDVLSWGVTPEVIGDYLNGAIKGLANLGLRYRISNKGMENLRSKSGGGQATKPAKR